MFDVLEKSKIRYFTEAEWSIGENPEILLRLAKSGCVLEVSDGKYEITLNPMKDKQTIKFEVP